MVAAENRLSMLAQRARSAHHDRAPSHVCASRFTPTLDRSDRGVEVCLEYLRRGGIDWSPHPTSDRSAARIRSNLVPAWKPANRGTRRLAFDDQPGPPRHSGCSEPRSCRRHCICDENLSSLVICRMVNLSLEHGNSDGSCFAYVWFAIIAGPRFGNYKDGFRFGRLGYELVEKRGLKRYQARTYMSFGNIVMPWTRHVLERPRSGASRLRCRRPDR